MDISPSISLRASELLHDYQRSIRRRTDRNFAVLMVLQWVACVVVALWISPKTWIDESSPLHLHVMAAIILGGVITALPVFLAATRPGDAITRHVIAISQMLFSAAY